MKVKQQGRYRRKVRHQERLDKKGQTARKDRLQGRSYIKEGKTARNIIH
jgi:hypothetical protein